MKKLFGGIDLTWKKLILFAIITGVYTGIMAVLPFTRDTSFRDISISFEWWVLFGILIIMNSKSNLDSALKCFVFFLISQPLVYLTEVPFNEEGFGVFRYYPGWFVWTLFTFPMGYIGYFMKKGRWISLLILSPMLLFLGLHFFEFFRESVYFFPNHLLSAVFCAATMFLYVLGICSGKWPRRTGIALCAVVLLLCIVLTLSPSGRKNAYYSTEVKFSSAEYPFDETSTVYLEDSKYGSVSITEMDISGDSVFAIHADFQKTGSTKLYLVIDDVTHVFDLEIGRSTYDLTEIENP